MKKLMLLGCCWMGIGFMAQARAESHPYHLQATVSFQGKQVYQGEDALMSHPQDQRIGYDITPIDMVYTKPNAPSYGMKLTLSLVQAQSTPTVAYRVIYRPLPTAQGQETPEHTETGTTVLDNDGQAVVDLGHDIPLHLSLRIRPASISDTAYANKLQTNMVIKDKSTQLVQLHYALKTGLGRRILTGTTMMGNNSGKGVEFGSSSKVAEKTALLFLIRKDAQRLATRTEFYISMPINEPFISGYTLNFSGIAEKNLVQGQSMAVQFGHDAQQFDLNTRVEEVFDPPPHTTVNNPDIQNYLEPELAISHPSHNRTTL